MALPPDDTAPEPLDLGTAGTSARREHARRRANREKRTREKHPVIGGALLALRGDPGHERVWARGAAGEEHVARELAKRLKHGALVVHDRRIPGSRANLDHIAIAPSGVWVIDSKRYKGKVAIQAPLLGRATLTVAGRDKTKLIDGLARQVELVKTAMADIAPEVPVHGALCFVDADLPLLFKLTFKGFPILYPRQLAKRTNAAGPVTDEGVQAVAAALATRFSVRVAARIGGDLPPAAGRSGGRRRGRTRARLPPLHRGALVSALASSTSAKASRHRPGDECLIRPGAVASLRRCAAASPLDARRRQSRLRAAGRVDVMLP